MQKRLSTLPPVITSLRIDLPAWACAWLDVHAGSVVPADDTARMDRVLDLAQRNVQEGTGGPFAAAIFADDGDLVAIGVNHVVPSHNSVLHAEIMAIMLAEQRVGQHRLPSTGRYTLYCSAEPCAMCLGAIPWSGLCAVVTAATDADVRAIGFDEGDKPAARLRALEARNITVRRFVQRAAAVQILQDYRARGGPAY